MERWESEGKDNERERWRERGDREGEKEGERERKREIVYKYVLSNFYHIQL